MLCATFGALAPALVRCTYPEGVETCFCVFASVLLLSVTGTGVLTVFETLGIQGFLLHNACGEGARLGCLLLERLSVDYEKKSTPSFTVWTCPKRRPSWSRVLWYADETLMMDMRPCTTS